MKKLLIIVSNLGHGGAERQVVEIANGLDRNKFAVSICSLSPHVPLSSQLKKDVALHIIEKKLRFDLSVIWRLYNLMRKEQFDIAHAFLYDAEIATRLAGKLCKIPLVIGSERNTEHNYSGIQQLVNKLTIGLLDLCIANSKTGAAYHKQTFGLPDRKYAVVYNGVDTHRFLPRSDDTDAPNKIGMVASFKPQKNHPYIVETIAHLHKIRQDFRFVMVGSVIHEGEDRSSEYFSVVKRQIADNGLDSVIEIQPATNDIDKFYNSCALTVIPSLFEGTPNVALESLACGVPVIATDVSDNASLIPDGRVGYIVPLDNPIEFAEKIDSLLANNVLREAFSVAAREWACSEFSIPVMIGNLEKIYNGHAIVE